MVSKIGVPTSRWPVIVAAIMLLIFSNLAMLIDIDNFVFRFAHMHSHRTRKPEAGERSAPYYTRARKQIPTCVRAGRARTFLMVFMSRSGSTAISQTMANQAGVSHGFELLEERNVIPGDTARALNETRAFFDAGIKAGRMPGYKIRSHYVLKDPAGWAALAAEYDTRIIWQYRKNVFKAAIGVYARVVLGDTTATSGIPKDELIAQDRCSMGVGCSFRIENFKEMHNILTNRIEQDMQIMQAVKAIDGERKCVFELPYEDYLYYQRETMQDLFAFLGVKAHNLETFRAKATADNLCKVIKNYDEICTTFYGCPVWQPYLDDFKNDCRCRNFITGSAAYCLPFSDQQVNHYVENRNVK